MKDSLFVIFPSSLTLFVKVNAALFFHELLLLYKMMNTFFNKFYCVKK